MRISYWSSDVCSSDLALVVMEEFGRRLVVEPFSETAIVAGTLIAKLGTAAQRSDLLPPIMAGDAIWALAHEEGYANGADDVRTVAILEGEGYRIDGAKAVVAAAGWADRLLVSARIGAAGDGRSEEHTSELQSLMRTSYAVFCL